MKGKELNGRKQEGGRRLEGWDSKRGHLEGSLQPDFGPSSKKEKTDGAGDKQVRSRIACLG